MLISQLSGPNGTVCLPEPGRPTVLTAQVPRPRSNRTKVPKNSASIAPAIPARSFVKVVGVAAFTACKVVNVISQLACGCLVNYGRARTGVAHRFAGKRGWTSDVGHRAGAIVTSSKLA